MIKKGILPKNFDDVPEEDEINMERYCVCGHLRNLHSNGEGGGISVCEEIENDCGCIFYEYDRDLTIENSRYWVDCSGLMVISKETEDTFIISENYGDKKTLVRMENKK